MIRESTSCVVEKGLAAFKASSGKKNNNIMSQAINCFKSSWVWTCYIKNRYQNFGSVMGFKGENILDITVHTQLLLKP